MVAGWLLLSAACTGAAQPGTEPSVAPMSTSATPPSGASAQPTTLARRRSRTQVALVTAELRNELVVVEHARVQLEDLGQWPQRGPAGEGSRAPLLPPGRMPPLLDTPAKLVHQPALARAGRPHHTTVAARRASQTPVNWDHSCSRSSLRPTNGVAGASRASRREPRATAAASGRDLPLACTGATSSYSMLPIVALRVRAPTSTPSTGAADSSLAAVLTGSPTPSTRPSSSNRNSTCPVVMPIRTCNASRGRCSRRFSSCCWTAALHGRPARSRPRERPARRTGPSPRRR